MAPDGTTTQQGPWVLNRATNEGQVRNDIHVIRYYVKDILFEKSVVVWHKSALAKNGVFHKDYMKNCRAFIADVRLMVISSKEASRRVHEHVVDKGGIILYYMDGKETQRIIPSNTGRVHE
jgi:hypothetical protein